MMLASYAFRPGQRRPLSCLSSCVSCHAFGTNKPPEHLSVKRPGNAYSIFYTEKFPLISKANPDLNAQTIACLAGKHWQGLTDTDKKVYEKAYTERMVAYRAALLALTDEEKAAMKETKDLRDKRRIKMQKKKDNSALFRQCSSTSSQGSSKTSVEAFEECKEILCHGDMDKLKSEFLRRMFDKNGSEFHAEKFEQWTLRLRHLEQMGLKWYEAKEAVALLDADEHIVQRKMSYLEAAGYTHVSMRMLDLIDPRRLATSLRSLEKWMNEVKPCTSVAEHIMKRLECTENDVICVYFALVDLNLKSKLIDKFVALQNAGFSLRDICSYAHLFQHTAYSSLAQRLKSNPTCISEVLEIPPMKELAKLLHLSEEVLQQSELISAHGGSTRRSKTLLGRVKILLEAGYDPTEVRQYLETRSSRSFARESRAKYVESLKQLRAEGLTASSGLQLRALGIHSRQKQLLQEFRAVRPSRYDIAKSLDCHFTEIQPKLPREKHYSRGFTRSDISKNRDFLCACGFGREVMKRLPSVLCVNPFVLSQTWEYVRTQPQYDVWKTNEWTLLNVLMYFAEKKEHNV